MDGSCDFCPRPARLAKAMCVHEHLVGVWVCAEKHSYFLEGDEIACRICADDVPRPQRHFCPLTEVVLKEQG